MKMKHVFCQTGSSESQSSSLLGTESPSLTSTQWGLDRSRITAGMGPSRGRGFSSSPGEELLRHHAHIRSENFLHSMDHKQGSKVNMNRLDFSHMRRGVDSRCSHIYLVLTAQ